MFSKVPRAGSQYHDCKQLKFYLILGDDGLVDSFL